MSDATSATLLGRLRHAPTDQAAWREFVDRYGVVVYRWCRHWGVQEADAEDITQAVMVDLGRQMRTFEYDRAGRFRAWLRTVARRAWCDFLAERQRKFPASGGTTVHEQLQAVGVEDDLLRRLDAECEREMLDATMARVQARVEARTFEAFRLMAIDGLSGAEAAARAGVSVASAFQARSRVQRLLQDEIAALNGGDTA